ncbi:iron ABC transporter substrate-binding protein [Intrasporangium chromatireducens Q5-1]|uniref:Iron ABC transporter substrate-binding protein n=1 Tax=Intrasporangium chromatireducens Q5-1 TaxID=584657 RepID=W9GEF2_9MICO|nr:iron ABC transporter substrate-binding protein [Intrasporangium chromatireducens]EWT04445.1 iron ABC transporter substrate-binding protein [Intrasporangium chromatireducens Q5-1]
MTRSRAAALVATVAASALLLTACGGSLEASGQLDANKLTIYSAQHKNLTEEWAKTFQDKTGVQVQIRYGNDSSMGAQIVQEGTKSPADVFLTENSPAMTTVQNAGLLAKVDDATIGQVGDAYVPSSHDWVGIAARSTVLVYNPSKISEAQLPTSIMDLAKPEYAGKWGAAAGGADFQAIVSAILELKGQDATAAWLAALKSGAKIYQNNIATMKAVNAGQVPMGIIYHYYWYRDQALDKSSSGNTKLHYFKHEDPGAFVSLSGGAVLKSSKHANDAQKFLAFVTSKDGQQLLASSDAKEYAVGRGVASDPALPPLDTLEAPKIDPFTLNGPKVIELMTQAGIL